MSVVTQVYLLKYRRTKIVATLGPSSDSVETITQLIDSGVNVYRLNMSHGDHRIHAQTYQKIREISEKLKKSVGILVDLCGPKIRAKRAYFANIITLLIYQDWLIDLFTVV